MMTIVNPGRRGDPQRQGVQLPGQRRLLAGRRRQHPGDLPDLGVAAGRGHDHHAAAVRDRRMHERHVASGRRARDPSPSGASTPFDAGTLSPVRPDSSICNELACDDPAVRRYVVAGGQQDDVADHHLLGGDLGLGSVAADPRRRLDHRLERVHRALRLALLAQADDRVEHRDQKQQARPCSTP